MWTSGFVCCKSLAADKNIYQMPYFVLCIMNLNPNNDSLSIVGKGAKFCGTVVGNDDCAGVALLLELISVYIGLH